VNEFAVAKVHVFVRLFLFWELDTKISDLLTSLGHWDIDCSSVSLDIQSKITGTVTFAVAFTQAENPAGSESKYNRMISKCMEGSDMMASTSHTYQGVFE